MRKALAAQGDNLVLAVSAIVFTVFALALGDAIVKRISSGFPLWQIFVFRSMLAACALIVLMRARSQPVGMMPASLPWTVLRSLMLTLMWVAYYTALPHVQFSAAAAVYYTLPLFISLFAALFTGERVNALGWLAVLLGFAGVLLILRPQAADFNAYALLPLASAILYALAMILTRTKCRSEHPFVLSLALNATFIAVGVSAALLTAVWDPTDGERQLNPFLLGHWESMGRHEWLVMSVLATAVIIGSVGAAIAYQSGPSSVVSTFDFAYLAFAGLWGYLFFGEVPTIAALFGTVLIAIAGIIAVRR